jgi:excinuclease ABC subunit A
MEHLSRLITVDQKAIGRTPRSNLATYTGLFDYVRKLFAATRKAKTRRYDVGRFSFNVAKGRCSKCEGAGFVSNAPVSDTFAYCDDFPGYFQPNDG